MAKKVLTDTKPTPAKFNVSSSGSGQAPAKKGPNLPGTSPVNRPPKSGSHGRATAPGGKKGPNIKTIKLVNKPPKAK